MLTHARFWTWAQPSWNQQVAHKWTVPHKEGQVMEYLATLLVVRCERPLQANIIVWTPWIPVYGLLAALRPEKLAAVPSRAFVEWDYHFCVNLFLVHRNSLDQLLWHKPLSSVFCFILCIYSLQLFWPLTPQEIKMMTRFLHLRKISSSIRKRK